MPQEQDMEERWRALAQEAFAISQQLSDPAAQRIMLRIAEAHAGLADRAKLFREGIKNLKKS